MQTPAWQVSLRSQRLPSLQSVPLVAVGFEHTPVAELHVPAVWHSLGAGHVTWLPAVQTPVSQVSVRSHLLPSLHEVPLVTGE